jgi:hypothetical protein
MGYKERILLPKLTEIIELTTEMGADIAKCEVSNTKAPAQRAKQQIWKIEKILVSLKSELNSVIRKDGL